MRIAITGYGIVSALGIGAEATWQSLSVQHSGIGAMRVLGSVHHDLPVGEVPFSDVELKAMCNAIAGKDLGTLSRSAMLGIVAANEALCMAECKGSTSDMAFVSGTTVGGMDITERVWRSGSAAIDHHSAGSCTDDISRAFGSFAFATTLSTACSSALNAIIYGSNMLRTGQYRRVLVGGTEALTLFHLNGFNSLRILDTNPCRPYDSHRAGLNLGEGAAYLVLEAVDTVCEHAQAYVVGYANRCDAYHQTATSQEGLGPQMAMRGAMAMANVKASDIDYINTHGTATPNNDTTELTALRAVFGDDIPPFSSTKAFTGHTTSASGTIETVLCLLGMRHGVAFANLRYESGEAVGMPLLRDNMPNAMDIVMCNSFAFGGNDSSLLVSRTPNADLVSGSVAGSVLADTECDDPMLCRKYLSPLQARRLTAQMKCLVAAAYQALEQAAIKTPDAIIAATQWGCIGNTMLFLNDMLDNHEQELSPTPFMNSTHNTPAALLAQLLGCHGYNSTISHDEQSLENALLDARMLIGCGEARNVLVLDYDEANEEWNAVLTANGIVPRSAAKAMVLKRI